VDINGQADMDAALAESNKRLVVVDFGAEWCGWCQKIKGPLADLVKEDAGTWQLARLDVDHNKDLKAKYEVSALPTLIAFRNGKELTDARWGDENNDGNFKQRLRTWLDTQLKKS
jgi:thioredoxin-like negative regulator of GroEL